MRNKFRKILCCILCISFLLSLGACKGNGEESSIKYDSLESMSGISAGVFIGSNFDHLLLEKIPTAEIDYYQSAAECIGALLEGKIDITLNEEGPAILSVKQNPELTVLPYKVGSYQYGAIFNMDSDGYALRDDFNSFIKETWSSDSLAYLYSSWLSNEDGKDINYQSLPATNGTITVATDSVNYPLTFIRNGNHTGFEVELIYNYCKSRGYALKFDIYDFGGVLAAISAGKADIGMSSIIITDERKESFYFSNPYATGSALLIIRKENAPGEYNNIRELDGKKIGSMSGTIYDVAAKENIVNSEIEYLGSVPDIMAAIRDGEIDAGVFSDINYDEKLVESYGLFSIGDVGVEDIACALSKTEKGKMLKAELDEYILTIKENGKLDAYKEKWLNSGTEHTVDYSGLKGDNGTLKLVVSTAAGEPACYKNGDSFEGYDIDIVVGFAKEYGYDIEITDVDFRDLISLVSEGEYDLGFSNITVTEGRKEKVLFSEPYYEGKVLVIVKKQDTDTGSKDVFSEVKNKINRTLIEEDRYKLYISGIKTTCLITFTSAVCGLVLGYFLFYHFRSDNKWSYYLFRLYELIFTAPPVVVVLMIFYYIVFGNSKLSGVWISVIAFTFIFSVSVFGLLKTCFKSVDKGQYEAAYALGYSKNETLHSIIIPQVLPIFIPPFYSEFMNLFKATAIVGYIAVQDITKISDIIRSRTYEAFFPLVITTIIYFVITAIFGLIMKYIEKKIDRKSRDIDKILKGAREDD